MTRVSVAVRAGSTRCWSRFRGVDQRAQIDQVAAKARNKPKRAGEIVDAAVVGWGLHAQLVAVPSILAQEIAEPEMQLDR